MAKEGDRLPPPVDREVEADPDSQRNAATFAHDRGVGTPSRETEGLYRLLVDSVRDYAIFALDANGNILSWNAGAEHLKGYRPEEIIGRHFSAFYPPEDIAAGKPDWELVVAAQEGSFEDLGWRIRKDGSRFWANVVITALRDTTGRLVGFAKVTRDLTERYRAEEALRQSEERFRLIVQSVTDHAIFMLDPSGHVATWNDGARRIKGYEASEIIGQHFSVFFPAEDLMRGKPSWELEAAVKEGRFEDEGWRIRKDGTRFWANVVITPIRNDHGTLLGFTKVTRDLTERRAAEERAIADARRLAQTEAANVAKSAFLATLSHELRTPLNAIGGYAQLLSMGLGGQLTEEGRDYVRRVLRSQQHLLALINDLLNYSRMEAGQLTYHFERVPLQEAIDSVAAMITPQVAARSLTLHFHPCPPEIAARADRGKLDQILLNLVSNALKFTAADGSIEIRCEAVGDNVAVLVTDTGSGIPHDKLEAIFEPFVQVGRTLTSRQEGAGLGLAISRDLARAMQGELDVTSTVGKGSTFRLTLPKA